MSNRVSTCGACVASITLAVAVPLLAGNATADDAKLDNASRAVYSNAYEAMTTGDAYDGAVQLIELLRTVPGDDVAWADALIGPFQLLSFSIIALMDWPERTQLQKEVMQPEVYPSDALFIAAMQAGSGDQSMALPGRFALEKLSTIDHQAVRATALYFLAQPYYFPGAPAQQPAAAELFICYPKLEFTRFIVEMPAYYTLDKAVKEAGPGRSLYENVTSGLGTKDLAIQSSPGFAKAAEALPSMNTADLDDMTVAQWAETLAKDTDPRVRYTLLSLLSQSATTPERRAAARPGIEKVAALAPTSPEVVRARMILADFAREDHESEALQKGVLDLLRLGILPCTSERSLYEFIMLNAQAAAKYYTRLGWHQQAIQIHEALAAKFPDTMLSKKEYEKADAIRADALRTTLTLIDMEVHAPLHNGDTDAVIRYYEDILAHSQHEALKFTLRKRLNEIPQAKAAAAAENAAISAHHPTQP